MGRKMMNPMIIYITILQGYPQGLDGHGLGQAKTKRARTSFKHHQLRIMKAHFQINQNPDSRELKMLSQKTGLDKKVLQVSSGFFSSFRHSQSSPTCLYTHSIRFHNEDT